jgi:hypothetical protein
MPHYVEFLIGLDILIAGETKQQGLVVKAGPAWAGPVI